MKKIMTIMGLAGLLCLSPACRKSDVQPGGSTASDTKVQEENTASLFVLLDSKPCTDSQKEYTSATVDIRGIKVYNTEHGWEDLTPVPGAWDVVSLQTATVPIAAITETSTVHAGTITRIALTIGDNNHLVVNNAAARCYKIDPKEVVLELEGDIKAGTLNQIVVSIDICGNITVEPHYNDDPCYLLKPVMAFESLTKVMIPTVN